MGSATLRRLALVAVILLLAPVWCRPSVADAAPREPSPVLVHMAKSGASAIPAIRRQAAGSWRSAGAGPDHGPVLTAIGLFGFLSLIALAPWATLPAMLAAPSPLGRRRHLISLRAPPHLRAL